MIKKIIISLASLLFFYSCATNQPIHKHQETVVQPPVQPNGGWSAVYSPDGSMIAFLSSTLHTPADLWVMKADGSGARRLTTRGVQDFRWSKDGSAISFVTRRKGFEEVMSIDTGGGGAEKRVPGLPPGAGIPVYSPDGSLFAFTAPGGQNIRDLWIGTSDGKRVEPITEKIGVRSVFWGTDSRKIYYEVGGKGYGVGIWELDLSTMESKAILNKYVGTPAYSAKAGRIAYPYPSNPGEFEVYTMKPDGSDIKTYKAPRLAGRWIAWDTEGQGIYYPGQDIEKAPTDSAAKAPGDKDATSSAPHDTTRSDIRHVGVNSLWRLDLATGEEKRISPASLHVSDFSVSSDNKKIALTGVLEKSFSPEIFSLDTASGSLAQLVGSRVSSWMPVLSPQDASKIAFFTNDGTLNTLTVVSNTGERLTSYPGFLLEGDTRFYWLPESDGLAVFSGRGLFAFTEKGPVEFPNKGDFRTYLYADVSIQEDKVLLSVVPRYGETPGLYQLQAVDNKFVLTDLRFPSAPEWAAERYLHPRWSLDGKKIAFTDGIDVWTMKADGTDRKWITNFAREKQEGKGREAAASYPIWSVKADMFCFTLSIYEEKRIIRELWVVKADGTGSKMLFSEEIDSQFQVFQPEYTNQPFFDAADERVIFTVADKGVPNIVSVDIKDGKLRRLTDNGAVYPALAPEEGAIYYTSLEGNTEELWIMNSDGTGKRRFEIKPAPPEKIETPAPAAASAAAPVKEVDKPAAPMKETEAVKEEPAKKKEPVKKKLAKKKATAPEKKTVPVVSGTESVKSKATGS